MTKCPEMELKHGQTERSTLANIQKGKCMEQALYSTATKHTIKDSSLKTMSKDTVSTSGKTGKHMKETGLKTKCMVKEFFHFQTVGITQDNSKMTRNQAKEYSPGLMEDNMKENGRMINKMGKGRIQAQVGNLKKVSGQMVKELSGMNDIYF